MVNRRQTIRPTSIDLTDSQTELLVSLVDAGYELSCDLISKYWDKRWSKCPLCGQPLDVEGFVVHEEIQ